jgi:hypothetical protein
VGDEVTPITPEPETVTAVTVTQVRRSTITPEFTWRDVHDQDGRRLGSLTLNPDGGVMAVCTCLTPIPATTTDTALAVLTHHRTRTRHRPDGRRAP